MRDRGRKGSTGEEDREEGRTRIWTWNMRGHEGREERGRQGRT